VQTTVFPWVAAGGAPGRVAVAFYGTTSDGDPNSGDFKGAWNVYVNQSLNALDASRTFSQVSATTHPFHYDSICLNGLGCDLAVPPGDRTLADAQHRRVVSLGHEHDSHSALVRALQMRQAGCAIAVELCVRFRN